MLLQTDATGKPTLDSKTLGVNLL